MIDSYLNLFHLKFFNLVLGDDYSFEEYKNKKISKIQIFPSKSEKWQKTRGNKKERIEGEKEKKLNILLILFYTRYRLTYSGKPQSYEELKAFH